MAVTHDDVLRAAMQLPERERMLLAEELIESVPEDDSGDRASEAELLQALAHDHAALWGNDDPLMLSGLAPSWRLHRSDG